MTDTTITYSYIPGMIVIRIVNIVFGVIESVLALRIILELFGASEASQFVAWIYSITAGMMGPFNGAFPGLSLGGNSVIDIVAILAMIAYAILGWLIDRLLVFLFSSAARM